MGKNIYDKKPAIEKIELNSWWEPIVWTLIVAGLAAIWIMEKG